MVSKHGTGIGLYLRMRLSPKVAFTGASGGGSNLVALKKPAPAPASVPSHLNPNPAPSSQASQVGYNSCCISSAGRGASA